MNDGVARFARVLGGASKPAVGIFADDGGVRADSPWGHTVAGHLYIKISIPSRRIRRLVGTARWQEDDWRRVSGPSVWSPWGRGSTRRWDSPCRTKSRWRTSV